jgi:hypothetical protein
MRLEFPPLKETAAFSPLPRVVLPTIIVPSQNRRMASPSISLTSDENVGLFMLAGMAGLSAIAIVGLLSYIVVSCTHSTLRMSIDDCTVFPKYSAVCILPGSTRRWKVGGPTEVYFLNQLGWDLVLSTGESWVDDNEVVS